MTADCSFCGKGEKEVRTLAKGPTACICDECLNLCNDIIGEATDGSVPDALVPPATEEPAVSEKRQQVTEQVDRLIAAIDGQRPRPTPVCSFCGEGQGRRRKLVAGPTVFICEQCVRRLSSD